MSVWRVFYPSLEVGASKTSAKTTSLDVEAEILEIQGGCLVFYDSEDATDILMAVNRDCWISVERVKPCE